MTTSPLHSPSGQLMSIAEAARRIESGGVFSVAGEEALLRQLPRGNWIGGTIPYFMNRDGGRATHEQVFVTELERFGETPRIRFHDLSSIGQLCIEAPDNGYSLLVIPAFSALHSHYARNAPSFEDMFVKPVIGWISGVHLDRLGESAPAVINGQTGEVDAERAIVMHLPLPPERYARVEIINRFEQGDGDRIRFHETGFSVEDCLINGTPTRLADYLRGNDIDLTHPLVADYSGAMINVSFKGIDAETGRVDFYAPVFADVEYRLARTRADAATLHGVETGTIAFSCNCVLNFVYDALEGRSTGRFTGPITFGEIAFLLLNQTLVYLVIE